MNRFNTIAVCKMIIIVSAIMTFSASEASALYAPYLTSATPTNGHSVALTWRNNDFAATQVLVLRKTAATAWVLKDSVAGTVSSYTDSSLQPLTGYSFALIASAPGLKSDTSNVLTATTLKASEIFAVPAVTVLRIEGQKFITIMFFDSSNSEKGFRLFRKSLTDPWAAIDSVISKAPDANSWKSFADSSITDNKWYSYKVQVYNDSQTAFSAETTVYNYARPKTTNSYVIAKKGSIPAKPISWVESIGDSLYFPEVAAPGDTEITLVDVSNNLSPQFRSYISPKNIPVWLKGSVVEARIKIADNGLFTHRNGYYIVGKSAICQYDSISLALRDSISCRFSLNWLIGWLNDSCCFIGDSFTGIKDLSYYAQPVHFGPAGIDTLPGSITWGNPAWWISGKLQSVWGCYNNIAVFSITGNTGALDTNNYKIYDFSTGLSMPLISKENVTSSLFAGAQSLVFDTSVAFTTTTAKKGIALYAFDIADKYSGSTQAYLGMVEDSNYACGNVKEIFVDTKKKCAYIIGDSGISIYSYSIGPAGVRTPVVSRNSAVKRIAVSQNSRGVSFNIIGAKMQSLQVLNVKGQTVRLINIPAGESFIWNRQDNAGRAVPVGLYIYKIGTLKDGVMGGALVLTR